MKRLAKRTELAVRVTTAAWLAGWYWKAAVDGPHLLGEVFAIPLRDEAFPAIVQSPWVSAVAWTAPSLALAAVAFPRLVVARVASGLMTACALVLAMHVGTGADATFDTSFWVALWLTWLAWNGERTDDDLVLHARTLARCIIGLLFLGAALGKLTPEYTTGRAFYRLYFADREEWPYPALRAALSDESLRDVARWCSRGVIAIEGAMAATPLFPHRAAVIFALVVLAAMTCATTFYLISVLACLAGMLVASSLLAPPSAESDAPHDRRA